MSLTTAEAGQLRGLLIGIDAYPGLGAEANLAGAVNDARDIAEAIKKAGAQDVTALIDGDATKARIEGHWRALVARSQPGDTIVFSYAGHGSQEPEPPGRSSEKDGKNENFILGGYTFAAPGNGERIVDDEIFNWLKMADDKDVRVIFIADSCHSGTMYRSAAATNVRFRNVTIPDITDDQLTLPPPTSGGETPSSFRNVTFVSATEESRKVPEVPIDGQTRGALSYTFARALEGGADIDKDGRITQSELVSFLVPKVHSLVEGQQSPQVLPVKAGGTALVETRQIVVDPVEKPADDILKVYIDGGQANLLANVPDIALVKDHAEANVVWNVGAGTVEHVPGGRVAENVTPQSIIPILSKWTSLKWLESHAAGSPGKFILHSGNHRYNPGQQITLSFTGAERPYLTLFNIAPDGRVEFFVADREVNIDWRGKKEQWRFKPDKPPFGAEHMVAIMTDEPLVELHAALKAMSSADRAVALRAVLSRMLGSRKYQFGKIGIYTGAGS